MTQPTTVTPETQELTKENKMTRYGRNLDSLFSVQENPGDLPLLGAVCWFDLQSGAKRVTLETAIQGIQNTVTQAIIDEHAPPMPKPEQSFSHAVNNAATGIKDVQTSMLERGSDKCVASILERQEQKASNTVERVDFIQRSRVAVVMNDRQGNPLPAPIVVLQDPHDKVAQRIESLYQWHRDYLTPNDIRPMVTRTFESCERLVLRRAGGTYFVPIDNLEHVQVLFSLLRQIGCFGYMLPIFETVEALETLQQCAKDDAADDIADLIEEIDRFDEALDEGKVCRESTLQARLDKLDDLAGKSKLYSRLLRMDAEEIEIKMEQTKEKLHALITKRDRIAAK